MTREEAIKELKKVNTLDMPVRLCEAYYMSIEALEQEPCEDAISRQAVLDLISKFIFEIHTEGGRDLNAHTNDVLRQILRNVGSDRVLPSVNPKEPKTGKFAKWVASEIFDEYWEYNKDAFAEIACRKLAKLGIVRENGNKWELVEPQESEEV